MVRQRCSVPPAPLGCPTARLQLWGSLEISLWQRCEDPSDRDPRGSEDTCGGQLGPVSQVTVGFWGKAGSEAGAVWGRVGSEAGTTKTSTLAVPSPSASYCSRTLLPRPLPPASMKLLPKVLSSSPSVLPTAVFLPPRGLCAFWNTLPPLPPVHPHDPSPLGTQVAGLKPPHRPLPEESAPTRLLPAKGPPTAPPPPPGQACVTLRSRAG